jgi:hypothetical protein
MTRQIWASKDPPKIDRTSELPLCLRRKSTSESR